MAGVKDIQKFGRKTMQGKGLSSSNVYGKRGGDKAKAIAQAKMGGFEMRKGVNVTTTPKKKNPAGKGYRIVGKSGL